MSDALQKLNDLLESAEQNRVQVQRPQKPRKALKDRWLDDAGNVSVGHLSVRFYYHPKLNLEKSAQAGIEQFDQVVQIEVRVAGQKDSKLSIEVDPDDISFIETTWPGQWSNFKSGADQGSVTGTMLNVLGIDIGVEKSLQAARIFTVEQLSEIADGDAAKIRQGMALKEKALRFLKERDFVSTHDVLDMVEGMKAQMSETTAVLDSMKSDLAAKDDLIAELQKNQKLKPGPKSGNANAT